MPCCWVISLVSPSFHLSQESEGLTKWMKWRKKKLHSHFVRNHNIFFFNICLIFVTPSSWITWELYNIIVGATWCQQTLTVWWIQMCPFWQPYNEGLQSSQALLYYDSVLCSLTPNVPSTYSAFNCAGQWH